MEQLKEAYRGFARRKGLILIFLGGVTLLAAFVCVAAGSAGITPGAVLRTLVGGGSVSENTVIWNIRMPRVLTAVLCGMGLAAAGGVMQSVLKNPLASASTLGISQGAAFGAAFAIIVLGGGAQSQALDGVTITNPYLVSICAFVCAILATALILSLSRQRRMSPESMVLAGVALSSLFSGGVTLLQYFAEDVKVAAVVFWTFGDLGRTSWREVGILAAVVLVSLLYFIFNRWNYNALQGGDQTAKSLGVATERVRGLSMLVCAVATAAIVSFVGVINFIGLIAPHLARRLVGGEYRYLLTATALIGILLLLLSDLAARMLLAPVVLPIGAITSFLGAPMFLYLLFRRKGGRR